MVLLFEILPHLPPAVHMPTYYAVMRLILGVADNRTALKSFLSHIGMCISLCIHVHVYIVLYLHCTGVHVHVCLYTCLYMYM